MKRTLIVSALFLVLSACSGFGTGGESVSVTYNLEFDTKDPAVRQELLQAAMNVVQGRVEHLQGNKDFTLTPLEVNGKTTVTAVVQDQAVADQLTREVTRKATIRIMVLAEKGEEPDLTLETGDGYRETGVTEEHVKLVAAETNESGKGRVQFQFTDEGHKKLAQAAKQHPDEKMGIFVREKPMRFFKILDYKGDDLVVDDAPSVEIARIFADDMNVSLHVTFTPVAKQE